MRRISTVLAVLICCSLNAQNGTADTIYVDVTMEDRMLMNAGKPQKYGTQAYSITAGGKAVIYIWPVEDPDKLNQLRQSVGLSPIEEYLEMVKQQGVEIIYDKKKRVKDFIQH